MKLPDSVKRALRTFLQAFVGTLALLAVPAMTDIVRQISSSEPYEIDFRFWQGVVVAACISGVIALVSWAQNALEDKDVIPAVGKGK